MDRRTLKRIGWALGLSLALAAFWTWGSRALERRKLELRAFNAYLQGPLSDLTFAFTREDARAAAASAAAMEDLLLAAPAGPLREAFQDLLAIHREAALRRSPELRSRLIQRVAEMRDWMRPRLPLSTLLEVNALLTSLRELED